MENPFILLKFVGTDAFLMHSFLPHMSLGWKIKVLLKRIFIIFLDRYFIQEYIVDHENLGDHIRKGGLKKPYRVIRDPMWHPEPYEKKPHQKFNIVVYDPSGRMKNKKAFRWRYGIDIIDVMKMRFPELNWITIDGSADMSKIWPITDFFLRPCRVDGASRMRQEAELNNIPTYWTYENPNIFEAMSQIRKEVIHYHKSDLERNFIKRS